MLSGLVAMLREAGLAGEGLPGIPREGHLRTRLAEAPHWQQPSLKLAVVSPERGK